MAARLADEEFFEATGVLEMISQSPEDRHLYEVQQKFLHDEHARLIAVREEGREEGSLVRKIQLLQQLLGQSERSVKCILPWLLG